MPEQIKTVVIGDLHGLDTWKQVIEAESPFYKIIFLGDYFDSFDIGPLKQKENFRDLLKLKRDHPDRVILLVGNHDFGYLRGVYESHSGFQPSQKVDIQELLESGLKDNLIQMSYSENGYLFTHAGVTKTWGSTYKVLSGDLSANINQKFLQSRKAFGFQGYDLHGDDITQGPLWVRPKSLIEDRVESFTQVVGHTQTPSIQMSEGILFCDSIPEKTYLVIIDGKPFMRIL